jgi:hypothetical protein
MGTIVGKLKELEYNELITLAVIENYEDLTDIFKSDIKMPFSILYKLQKEGKLNDTTKEILVDIFEKVILTKHEFIDKYLQFLNGFDTETPVEVVVEIPSVEIEVPIVEVEIETPIKDKVSEKKESLVPRRYGKEKITKDIEAQGGIASPVQRAMLKVNDLKNIYVNLSTRGIKDMIGGTDSLSDEDCRKIVSAITTFERQMGEIVKTKAKKK